MIYALTAALAVMAKVSVVSEIEPIEIFVGQQADVTLKATVRKGQKAVFPDVRPSAWLAPGVEVVGVSPADTSDVEDGFITISRKYTITSFDEKLYYLPPMNVVVDGKKHASRSLALKVITVPVDTLHPEKFFPPKNVQTPPFSWAEWQMPFWLSIAFVLCVFAIVYLVSCLRGHKPVIPSVRIVRKVLPHKRALDAIGRIKADKLVMSEDQKTYYTRLTDALRQYIEDRFGFNAKEMTTSEIIENMQNTGDRKMINELRELFTTADLVKFAKHSALINENDANLLHAIEFINTTKLEGEQAEEYVKPVLTKVEEQSLRTRTIIKWMLGAISVLALLLLAYVAYHLYMLLM